MSEDKALSLFHTAKESVVGFLKGLKDAGGNTMTDEELLAGSGIVTAEQANPPDKGTQKAANNGPSHSAPWGLSGR